MHPWIRIPIAIVGAAIIAAWIVQHFTFGIVGAASLFVVAVVGLIYSFIEDDEKAPIKRIIRSLFHHFVKTPILIVLCSIACGMLFVSSARTIDLGPPNRVQIIGGKCLKVSAQDQKGNPRIARIWCLTYPWGKWFTVKVDGLEKDVHLTWQQQTLRRPDFKYAKLRAHASNSGTFEKPTVSVRFVLVDDSILAEAEGDNAESFQNQMSGTLANILNRLFSFAKFVPQTNSSGALASNHQMTISFGEHGTRGLEIVEFCTNFGTTNLNDCDVGWTYRDLTESRDLPTLRVDLGDAIACRYGKQASDKYTDLFEAAFSQLQLDDVAYPWREQASWALPFRGADLNVGLDSEFIIHAMLELETVEDTYRRRARHRGHIKQNVSEVPAEYYGKIQAELMRDEDAQELQELIDYEVKGIYLFKFNPLRNKDPC